MCFGRPGHFGRDARVGELLLQRGDHLLDVALAVEAALVQELRDRLVGRGLERAQAQVLELPLELPDAEPVGERREELEHLVRGALAPLRVAAHERSQRLRALGELDEDDANVLDHRKQHLAQVLRLRRALLLGGAFGRCANAAHARDAGDERRDFGAEARRDLVRVEGARDRNAEQHRGAQASRRRASIPRGWSRCRARGRARARRRPSPRLPVRARANSTASANDARSSSE